MLFGVSEMATFAILEIRFLEIARKSRRFSFFRSLRLKFSAGEIGTYKIAAWLPR